MSPRIDDHAYVQAREVLSRAREWLGDPTKARRHKTAAAWFDLLGFRKDLDLATRGGTASSTSIADLRVAGLHHAAIASMDEIHEIVQMNDAVLIGVDIPDAGDSIALDGFHARVAHFFELAVAIESQLGGCGVRGVIAAGERLDMGAQFGFYPRYAPDKPPNLVSPRPVNMNTAFLKAYGVESSHMLPKVSCLYVEETLLSRDVARRPQLWRAGDVLEIDSYGRYVEVRRQPA